MSGSVAGRYVGGLPYDPSRGVGQYARGPRMDGPISAPPSTPAMGVPGGGLMIDGDGQVVRVQPGAAMVQPTSAGGGGGAMGGGDMLLAAALGLLPYVPDAVDWIGRQFAGAPITSEQALASDPTPLSDGFGGTPSPGGNWTTGTFTGPGGMQIPNAALGGPATNWDNVFNPGWEVIDDPARMEQLLRPIEYSPGSADGFQAMGATPDDFASVSARAPGEVGQGWFSGIGDAIRGFQTNLAAQNAPMAGATLSQDLGLTGSLGVNPLTGGDLASGGANTAGAALGGLIASQAFQNDRGAYTQYGQQAGSALGGIASGALIGSALGPIGALFGGIAGGFGGGMIGGGAASQIGPAPTIGRNFATTGTLGADGGIQWGAAGGDNGGTAADATQFGSWLSGALGQRAADQGLAFNPNMAGAQFTIGGFDNFSRRGETPGGYFYTPGQAGASPENYALRPDGALYGAFSGEQANAFADSVLADLSARGVFTQGGQGQGLDYFNSTLGADLGWYGAQPAGFGDVLSQRQGAISGFLGQQQAQAQAQQQAQTALGANFDPNAQYAQGFDWSSPSAGWAIDAGGMAANEAGWNTGGG